MENYLCSTKMLDFEAPAMQQLICAHAWKSKTAFEQISEIYQFVRDEIQFGYNRSDSLSASQVLQDSYGQCNTKGTLFMALLRAVGIPCRTHGFTIDKSLQKGGNDLFCVSLGSTKCRSLLG